MKRFLICLTVLFLAFTFVNCKTGEEGSTLPGGKFNWQDLLSKFGKGKGGKTDVCAGVEQEGNPLYAEYQSWDSGDITRLWLPKDPTDVRIAYGTNASNFAELRFAKTDALKGPNGYPVMVVIHGGAWRADTPLTQISPMADAFSGLGFVSYNIEIVRRGNGLSSVGNINTGGYPATTRNTGAAIDHLRNIAEKYNLDLDRVLVTGHSSGGHLALWAASREVLPPGDPCYVADPLPVKGVISLGSIANMQYAYDGYDPAGGPTAIRVDMKEFLFMDQDASMENILAFVSPWHMLTGEPVGAHSGFVPKFRSAHYVGLHDNPWRVAGLVQYNDTVNAKAPGFSRNYQLPEDSSEYDLIDPCSPNWTQIVKDVYWMLEEDPPCDVTHSVYCPVKGQVPY